MHVHDIRASLMYVKLDLNVTRKHCAAIVANYSNINIDNNYLLCAAYNMNVNYLVSTKKNL